MNPEASLAPNLLATNFQTLVQVIVAVDLLGSVTIGDLKAMFADLRADLADAERSDGSKADAEAGEGEAVSSD